MTPEERAHATLLAEAHDLGLTGDEAEEYVHVMLGTAYGRHVVVAYHLEDLRAQVRATRLGRVLLGAVDRLNRLVSRG